MQLCQKQGLKIQQVDHLQDFLQHKARVCLTVAAIDSGLILADEAIEIIAEPQLFGDFIVQQRQRKRSGQSQDPDLIIKDLTELEVGAPVVH